MAGSWTCKNKGSIYIGVQGREREEDGTFLCNIPPACEKAWIWRVVFFSTTRSCHLSMSPFILISRGKRKSAYLFLAAQQWAEWTCHPWAGWRCDDNACTSSPASVGWWVGGGVGGDRTGEELRRPEPLDGPLHGTQQKAEQGLGGVGGYGWALRASAQRSGSRFRFLCTTCLEEAHN